MYCVANITCINALCQQQCHNLFLKIDISWNQFTQYFRLGNEVVRRGDVQGGGGGIRAGLEGNCNLLTGSWERASHHHHLFLRPSPSGHETLLYYFLSHFKFGEILYFTVNVQYFSI